MSESADFESNNSSSIDFVKLFVGQIPRDMPENELREMFAAFGELLEVVKIQNRKDPHGNSALGCAFVKYKTRDAAEAAIKALNLSRTLPPLSSPMQVRFADGENERLGSTEHKLFVGNLPADVEDADLRTLFGRYGTVIDVHILREDSSSQRAGRCAFVKYGSRDEALQAIQQVNDQIPLRKDSDSPALAVRFAENKKHRRHGQHGGRHGHMSAMNYGMMGMGMRPMMNVGFMMPSMGGRPSMPYYPPGMGFGGPAGPAPGMQSWTEHKDGEGRTYYYNAATQQSQWERPADMDAAPQGQPQWGNAFPGPQGQQFGYDQ